MFEYFLKKNNKTFAYDTKKGLKDFTTTNNIEDFFITSNNIEEIQTILTNLKNEYNLKKLLIQRKKINSIIVTLLILIGTIIFSMSNTILTLGILLLIVSNSITITDIISEKKLNKSYDMNSNILIKELTTENEKLNKLKEEGKTIDLPILTNKIFIDRSKKIKNLYRKLNLINFFVENNTELIKLYKSGVLNIKLQDTFSINDIIFITMLIEEQITKEEQLKKQKIKSIKK